MRLKRVVRLLGGSGGMPPPPHQENFMIFDLLRSFLVYSWGENCKKVGRPRLNLVVAFGFARRIRGMTLLRVAEGA